MNETDEMPSYFSLEFLYFLLILLASALLLPQIVGVLLYPFGEREARTRLQNMAKEQFKKDYPTARFVSASVIKQGHNAIVMISYGKLEPPNRKYYVVRIIGSEVRELEGIRVKFPEMDR